MKYLSNQKGMTFLGILMILAMLGVLITLPAGLIKIKL